MIVDISSKSLDRIATVLALNTRDFNADAARIPGMGELARNVASMNEAACTELHIIDKYRHILSSIEK